MDATTTSGRFQLIGSDGRVLELVPGPHPYLWIGSQDEYLADFGPEGLRELRDALTAALKHAKGGAA